MSKFFRYLLLSLPGTKHPPLRDVGGTSMLGDPVIKRVRFRRVVYVARSLFGDSRLRLLRSRARALRYTATRSEYVVVVRTRAHAHAHTRASQVVRWVGGR